MTSTIQLTVLALTEKRTTYVIFVYCIKVRKKIWERLLIKYIFECKTEEIVVTPSGEGLH